LIFDFCLLIWVRLLWNNAQAAQFQVLDEICGFLIVGKGGDMIISLGFRSKNAVQRLGGTRPAADTVIAGAPTRVPLASSRQNNSTKKCSSAKASRVSHSVRGSDSVEGRGPQWRVSGVGGTDRKVQNCAHRPEGQSAQVPRSMDSSGEAWF
jgi:hypothetical protein